MEKDIDYIGDFKKGHECDCSEKQIIFLNWGKCRNYDYITHGIGKICGALGKSDFSYEFIYGSFRCWKCRKNGNFTVECSNKGPQFRYGKYQNFTLVKHLDDKKFILSEFGGYKGKFLLLCGDYESRPGVDLSFECTKSSKFVKDYLERF